MMNIQKILVPLDFSDLSTKALEVSDKLAAIFGATITPVHVHIPITEMEEPYSLGMGNNIYPEYDKVEEKLRDRLKMIAEKHIKSSRIEDPLIIFGSPAQSIVELSESFDCIVMSTHGRTGFSRFLLGSVAEKVLRLSHVPVMVVENESDVGDFRNILVTTDFSEHAAKAFPVATEFIERTGSKIHLLHILSLDRLEENDTNPTVEKLRNERLKLVAAESFHEFGDSIDYSVIVTNHSPHEAILNHVKKHDYDLIIMATVGRTGIQYLMMGSTTANVVRHVNNAVLSINPKRTD